MMVSADSKYDRVIRHDGTERFSDAELQGYKVFKEECSRCHREPLFTDGTYRNNGLDSVYADIGRDSPTHNRSDLAKFRVPSLRNVEVTGPYTHNGRFRVLQQVLNHYRSGMKNHAGLDPFFKKNNKAGIDITGEEQLQVISFLRTLTDIGFINDRRFNNK